MASAARLRRLGFSVASLPAIEIKAQAVRPSRSRYDAVVATSGKAFLGDGPSDTSPPLYVVGDRTARAAKARGWRLASTPAPDAARLIEMLNGALRPGASVLYLAGRDRKGTIEAALEALSRSRSSKPMQPRRARPGARRRRARSRPASRRCIIRAARPGLRWSWRKSRALRRAFSSSCTSACRAMSPNRSTQPARPGSRSPKRLTRRDFFSP